MFTRSSKGVVLLEGIRRGFAFGGTFAQGSEITKWLQIEATSEVSKRGGARLMQFARAHALPANLQKDTHAKQEHQIDAIADQQVFVHLGGFAPWGASAEGSENEKWLQIEATSELACHVCKVAAGSKLEPLRAGCLPTDFGVYVGRSLNCPIRLSELWEGWRLYACSGWLELVRTVLQKWGNWQSQRKLAAMSPQVPGWHSAVCVQCLL